MLRPFNMEIALWKEMIFFIAIPYVYFIIFPHSMKNAMHRE